MRFALSLIASLLFLLQCIRVDVNAFTAGNLLPAYLCGPPNDGLPKSLGGYIQKMVRATNPNPATAAIPTRIDYGLDAANGGSLLNTQLVVANWHNRATIYPCNHTIFVNTSLAANPKIVNQIVPGQAHTLTLIANGKFNLATATAGPCDFYQNAGMVSLINDIPNIALDGAIVYAQDQNAVRIGNFTAFGTNQAGMTTMQPWAACGPANSGIVHNQLIDANVGSYTGITWVAPTTLVPGTSTVTFKGAAVSDSGFGAHATTLPVITPAAAGAPPVAPPAIQKIIEGGDQLVVFFVDNIKNAAAANAAIVPNNFVAKAVFTNGGTTTTATGTSTKSPTKIPIQQGMKGATVSVTVTASNTNPGAFAAPSTSAAVTFTLAPGQVVPKVNADAILSLCPADLVAQRASLQMDTDPDNQCDYQSAVINSALAVACSINSTVCDGNSIPMSSASARSPTFAIVALLSMAIAALALKH